MSRNKRPLQRKLRFENLEGRRLLTGNVTAKVTALNLVLTGDTQNNAIMISQMGANTYCITGENGTTVNGQSKISLSGVKNNVNITFLNGNDTVVLTNAAFPADVNVTLGKGTDLVEVGFSNDREFGCGSVSVLHNLNITLGNGACDEVEESALYVGHDQNIKLGDGNYDQVLLGESGSIEGYSSEFAVRVVHDFNVTLGNGNYDLVNLADVNVLYELQPTPAQVTESSGNPIADQAPSGGESVAVGHNLNITFGKGNGDSVIIDDNTEFDGFPVGEAANNTTLVTVGYDCNIVMGNGNNDNVTFNVSVSVDDGGDNGDDISSAISKADDPTGGTTGVVDGTLLAVGHNLSITLGNGNDDSVSPAGAVEEWGSETTYNEEPLISVGHDANVKLGSGLGDSIGESGEETEIAAAANKPSFLVDESPYFAVVVGHDLNITLGAGKYDSVELFDTYAGHNLAIVEGNGLQDDVYLEAVEIGANLAVTTGNGGDEIDLEYVEAFQANLTTGSGCDSVSIGDESDFAKLYVSLGAGNDSLYVDPSVYVSQTASFDGGTGSNSYSGGGPVGPAKVTKTHF